MKKKRKTRIKRIKQKKACLPAGRVKVIEPEVILERKAKVTDILEGFRKDHDKRREQLRELMNNLRMQRIKRREKIQKFMQNIRSRVLAQKSRLPEVKV